MDCATLPIGNGYNPPIHPAIDYDVPVGTPIYAPEDGIATTYKWNYSYGFHVVLAAGAWTFLYAHLSVISVPTGHMVKGGALLGLSGCTGHCTGPHVHYEVRLAGVPVDPRTMPCPFDPNPSTTGIVAQAIAGATKQGNLGSGVPASYTSNGVLRKYQSQCVPPKGGGFWSHIPFIAQAQAGVKETSYLICVVTDYDTYIRLAMIVFGAFLLIRGTIDFSKVLSPAFGAKLQSAHDAGLAAMKTAAVA